MPLDRQALHGHYFTIAPWISHVLRPVRAPASEPLYAAVDDPTLGLIPLEGRLRDREGASSLLVILHGLGGDLESHYVIDAATTAERMGVAHLRMNLRGADGSGHDFYHAGLFADVQAILAGPKLARFERIYVMGYSLGGHIALRYAGFEGRDPRVRAVAAVCPPLDLDRGAAALDSPRLWSYRRHLLIGLKAMYTSVATRRVMAVSPREAQAIRTLRAWDNTIVAPRFGYSSAEHYYAEESAGPRLGQITIPSLFVAAEADPMIPAEIIKPWLKDAPLRLDVRWLREGGHVGFPADIDIGHGSRERGLEAQVIEWLFCR